MALMNEAEASIKADPSQASALQTISMAYNMARLQEATGAADCSQAHDTSGVSRVVNLRCVW
jgi:hypothetical protein